MLEKVAITNFRGFEDHVLNLLPTTVIVGRNNAGKSTIVEALRLISLAVEFAKSRSYVPRQWLISRHLRTAKTRAPTLLTLEIDTDSVFHRYGSPPSTITAFFRSGAQIEITVYQDEIRAAFYARSQAGLPHVSILPQVAPVARDEKKLNADYIRSAVSSVLAPLHFRNQVYLLQEYFPLFKESAERSWPGLRVFSPEATRTSLTDERLTMMVTDGDFTAEIGWMGHGLQMWLQTMWFLARAREHETVILDEPDVYMHADLQRRLIRFLKTQHKQVIVATHSAEIMAEVEPEEILIIRKENRTSDFASSLPIAQEILVGLGSVHNLQLSRLAAAQRYVFVEGEDISVLKRFHDTLFPNSSIPLDTISMPIAGWAGWHYAIGTAQFLSNTAGSNLSRYCILDRDYHLPLEITSRYRDAAQRQIRLHIWKRKELENYLLVPAAIARFITGKSCLLYPTERDILEKIDELAESLKTNVTNSIGNEIQLQNRGYGFAKVSEEAQKRVDAAWRTHEGRLSIVPGKAVFSQLSGWSKSTFNVSFGVVNIAKEVRANELDAEVTDVISAIEKDKAFPLFEAIPV